MKILNCLVDDKFLDVFIEVMEYTKADNEVEYITITEKSIKNYKYIKLSKYVRNILTKDSVDYINNGHYDLVILHGLASMSVFDIAKIERPTKVLWKAWGYDIYRYPNEIHPFIKLDRLRPLTKSYWKRSHLRDRLTNLRVYFYDWLHRKDIQRMVERIDYFSGCLPVEYQLMMQNVPYFKAQHLPFAYFDMKIECSENNKMKFPTLGNSILVGNAAGIPNNHLDILAKLKRITHKERKLILPLNYGGDEQYIETITNYAKEYWGENVIAIKDFMEKTKYFDLLKDCSYAIFGHEQQAALGNIFAVLWDGVKVFLSETSVNYKFFKSIGFYVFSIQSELTQESITTPLTQSQKEHNRNVRLKYFSTKKDIEEFRQIYQKVKSDLHNNNNK